MNKINWTVRLKNKTFWLSIIPALLLLVNAVCGVFGVTLELDELGGNLLNLVEAVFVVLAILGVVTDHTTAGISDSEQALTYTEPKEG